MFEWDKKVDWSIVKAFDGNVVLRMLTFISWTELCALYSMSAKLRWVFRAGAQPGMPF